MHRSLLAFLLVSIFAIGCSGRPNPPHVGGGGGGGEGLTDDGGFDDDGGVDDAGEDGGAGGGSGDDGGTVQDAGELPTYSAAKVMSALDRIQIIRELQTTQPRCTVITLISPGTPPADGGLSLPLGWGLQSAVEKDKGCTQGGGTTLSTQSVTGTITFNGTGTPPFPASVDVHTDAFFAIGSAGSLPGDVRFDRDNVTVQ